MSEESTEDLVQLAWDALPSRHRQLLEQMGASRWEIVDRLLGDVVRELFLSPERPAPTRAQTKLDNRALGMWVPELRLVLINDGHQELRCADPPTREALVTWIAWHEWGHALSVTGFSNHDPSEGARLLGLAPPGIRERIRKGGYRRSQYIHELIAETYALLMRESVEGRPGRPKWLPDEIYQLTTRIGA